MGHGSSPATRTAPVSPGGTGAPVLHQRPPVPSPTTSSRDGGSSRAGGSMWPGGEEESLLGAHVRAVPVRIAHPVDHIDSLPPQIGQAQAAFQADQIV